jgi:hypothetical protein
MRFIEAILLTYGLVLLITQSSLMWYVKEWVKNLEIEDTFWIKVRELGLEWSNCVLCSGFWVGVIVGAGMDIFSWWNVVGNGGMLVGTTWILNALVGYLGNGYDPARVVNVIMRKSEEQEL